MSTHHDLDVYKRSYALALRIHKLSLKLPKELQYDLADQIRRSSRSVPANIAEGYSRDKSKKDILNFIKTALGSNDEVLFNLCFLKDAGYINEEEYESFRSDCEVCGKQLKQLARYLSDYPTRKPVN